MAQYKCLRCEVVTSYKDHKPIHCPKCRVQYAVKVK